ncbi:MAG: cysteine-rich repeat protein [Acidimicrobiales bacterium]|jgi:cysteine-rich repeat protein
MRQFVTFLHELNALPAALAVVGCFFLLSQVATAQVISGGYIATTSLTTSICGNEIVDVDETCDVLGETGAYSTSILGRQCDVDCDFGPYCGDSILQTIYAEECDDGNNISGDFCNADCTIEPAGSGSGGSSGGGTQPSGGSDEDFGDTQVNVTGKTIPRAKVNIILDAKSVGTVKADSAGNFEFTSNTSPGTISMGFWVEDDDNIRSITFGTTFDVTQGAITKVAGILVPPTIVVSDSTINPGDTITFAGQAVQNTSLEVHIGDSDQVLTTISDSGGYWNIDFDTSGLSAAEYTARARFILGSGSLTTESSFSSTLQLFLGVDGSPTTPSDLNRDGLINLIDFSILIFWWGTTGGNSNPPADINGNDRVGLEDFSILLFNWTG